MIPGCAEYRGRSTGANASTATAGMSLVRARSCCRRAELTHLVVRRYLVVVGAGVGASDRPA